MNDLPLKSLKNCNDYSLQTFILQRPSYEGVRKRLDIADMNAGVLLANDYHYADFDCIIMGVNPVVNIIVAALCEMKGKNVLVSTLRMQDAWDYSQLKSIDFQNRLAVKFRLGFDFLRYADQNQRVLVFLDSFFKTMNKSFPKSVFISNSDIAISSDARKWNNQYLFKAVLGGFVDNLPFNEPKIGDETLYNKSFNLFYKFYCERENNWNYSTDVKNQIKNPRILGKLDEHAFYHILSPKVLITSHYHPYIQDKELEDNSVFKIMNSKKLDDLEKWIKEM